MRGWSKYVKAPPPKKRIPRGVKVPLTPTQQELQRIAAEATHEESLQTLGYLAHKHGLRCPLDDPACHEGWVAAEEGRILERGTCWHCLEAPASADTFGLCASCAEGGPAYTLGLLRWDDEMPTTMSRWRDKNAVPHPLSPIGQTVLVTTLMALDQLVSGEKTVGWRLDAVRDAAEQLGGELADAYGYE